LKNDRRPEKSLNQTPLSMERGVGWGNPRSAQLHFWFQPPCALSFGWWELALLIKQTGHLMDTHHFIESGRSTMYWIAKICAFNLAAFLVCWKSSRPVSDPLSEGR
jgi:hypothetical protein